MDADASGVALMSANTSANGRPRSSSTMARTVSKGTLGLRSRQAWNSWTYSSGKSVGEDAMNYVQHGRLDYVNYHTVVLHSLD